MGHIIDAPMMSRNKAEIAIEVGVSAMRPLNRQKRVEGKE